MTELRRLASDSPMKARDTAWDWIYTLREEAKADRDGTSAIYLGRRACGTP